jgi:OmpA-OmpF porin, OOP family
VPNTIVATTALALSIAVGLVAPAAQTTKQPEFTKLKADFVPGEKTLFYDDFTDMEAGDPPKRFKGRGAAFELMAAGDVRQLVATANGSLFPNLTGLPKNFTYEADVYFGAPTGRAGSTLLFWTKDGKEALTWSTWVSEKHADVTASVKVPKYEELGRKRLPFDTKQAARLALWVQDGRVRVFVNGEKHLDINQVDVAPIDRVELRSDVLGAGVSIGYRSVRFAESAPEDFGDVLAASGRYVSHGILFDTDSDRLKPESAAPVQRAAKALQANPAVKVLIEGHTDAVGNAAHNLDLSKRRAEAVKAVLVSQFAVEASRLTTAGLGSTKPMDSNDTPLGRAQNRRVEFVKQ